MGTPIVAHRHTKYAVNCVRLHAIDHRWPKGIIMRRSDGRQSTWNSGLSPATGPSTRKARPARLVRLRCKNEGISLTNLNVAPRRRRGRRRTGALGQGAHPFDRRLIALQKDTRGGWDTSIPSPASLCHEPTVCLVGSSRMACSVWVGYLTSEAGRATATGIPSRRLCRQARSFVERAGAPLQIAPPLQRHGAATCADMDPLRGSVQRLHGLCHGCAAFAMRRSFTGSTRLFIDMREFLRGELGVSSHGTSDHGKTGPPHAPGRSVRRVGRPPRSTRGGPTVRSQGGRVDHRQHAHGRSAGRLGGSRRVA